MNKQHLRRPRIQRAFVRWFKENRNRFEVPVRLVKITAKGVELRFQNYPDCLSVWLSRNDELGVFVTWQGKLWDTLIGPSGSVRRWSRSIRRDAPRNWHEDYREGYVCIFCLHEFPNVMLFSSPEALWQDHIFDSFLEWVNEELAPARWLQLSCTKDGGATWARLTRDDSALEKPDRTLLLMQGLKRIDGTPSFEDGADGVVTWLISLKSETGTAAECPLKIPAD